MEDQGKYNLPPDPSKVTVPDIEKLPLFFVSNTPDAGPEIVNVSEFIKRAENPFYRLEAMAAAVHAVNKANGFWDQERNIGEMLMLVTSELSEALEAHRKGRVRAHEWALELSERPDADLTSDNSAYRDCVKDHFETEIIDALFRILDMIAGLQIPAERIAALILKANAARGHKHGKQY